VPKVFSNFLVISLAHLSKILVGFLLLKLIAYYLGTTGLGALGNFMSAVTIVSLLSGGGITTGIVKYIAEYKGKPKKTYDFILTATLYSTAFSLIIAILGCFYSRRISLLLFDSQQYYNLIIFLALAQMVYAFSNLVIGVCNGLQDTKTFAKIQLIGNLIFLPLSWILIEQYGIWGGGGAIILTFSGIAVPAFYYYRRSIFYRWVKSIRVRLEHFRNLSKFTLMLAVSSVSFPVVEILVRKYLINSGGYVDAGLWQGAIKLASAYVGFFSLFLAYSFMPIISAERTKQRIGKLVWLYMFVTALIFGTGAKIFIIWKDFFIRIFLAHDFLPLGEFIVYQFIGDFFRILSYVIGFVAVAKAATKLYIAAEIAQGCLFLFFISLSLFSSALENVMKSYMLSYIIYFFVVLSIFIFYLYIYKKDQC